ncbi:MAG TPA: hypothetical protein VFQ61_01235, partial [Polyangiaceae bacterium]|nr:hypothetical protein [Polyangiaceae bacterium]
EHGPVLGLALSGARVSSGTLAQPYGAAELTWMTLRAEFCSAASWPRARFFLVGGCAFLDLGQLAGQGRATGSPDAVQRASLWVAPGIHALVAWEWRRVLRLSAGIGVHWPLKRPEFRFSERDSPVTHDIYVVPNRPAVSLDWGGALLF